MSKVSPKQAAQALYEATKGKYGKELEAVLANSVEFLYKNRLLSQAPAILEKVQELIDKDEGIVRAKVESAHPLSKHSIDEIKAELKKKYNAKEIELETLENEKHLGGMRISIGNEIIDLTLRHQMNQLQNYLIAH